VPSGNAEKACCTQIARSRLVSRPSVLRRFSVCALAFLFAYMSTGDCPYFGQAAAWRVRMVEAGGPEPILTPQSRRVPCLGEACQHTLVRHWEVIWRCHRRPLTEGKSPSSLASGLRRSYGQSSPADVAAMGPGRPSPLFRRPADRALNVLAGPQGWLQTAGHFDSNPGVPAEFGGFPGSFANCVPTHWPRETMRREVPSSLNE
jgi:hypothetical protein